MQLIPIKTRVMKPPKDDLFELLEAIPHIEEGDVVLITSKVVSIGNGRCIPLGEVEKRELVEKEADFLLDVEEREVPMTIKHHSFIFSSGIDESNSDGYYTLLPENPYEDAKCIWEFLREKHSVKNIAIIITDSHSLPFRYGALSTSIGFYGMKPIMNYEGEEDLFGRVFKFERSNLVDSLAAAATLVSGEGTECTPIVIARGVPNITFVEESTEKDFLIPFEEDMYYPLLKAFVRKEEQMGVVSVKGLPLMAYLGIDEVERSKPQEIVIDADITLNLLNSLNSDDLNDTLDYRAYNEKVREYVRTTSHCLIETMAKDIALIYLKDPRAETVTLALLKPGAIKDAKGASVTVTLKKSSVQG